MTKRPRNRLAARYVRALVLFVFVPSLSWSAESASADRTREAKNPAIDLPPPPRERPSQRAVEVTVGVVGPITNRALCPRGVECVIGSGGSIGFTYERWRRSGFGFGLGYDLTILSGGTLWEAATIHDARFVGRYTFVPTRAVHPFVAFGAGGILLGNLFGVSTGGAAIDARLGAEFELTESLSFTLAFASRAMIVAPFRTADEEALRGRHGAPTVLYAIQVGLVLVPSTVR